MKENPQKLTQKHVESLAKVGRKKPINRSLYEHPFTLNETCCSSHFDKPQKKNKLHLQFQSKSSLSKCFFIKAE